MLLSKNNLWGLRVSIVLLFVVLGYNYFAYNKLMAMPNRFDAANIHSHIRLINSRSQGATNIAFENDSNDYYAAFYIENVDDHIKYSLTTFGEVGDSVIKETNSNYLYLFKKGKVYKYRIG